eukprot:TRINITY_DN2932_c0_g1_i2.p1 TRINITY_DN2932_c0_g1~~TRINITY_DN2932_c0_g1_i2.p1  ORF type:complete len:430 (-),score=54.02 TRINITY_DN2932_c0_g1_i2:143-1432(-)
MMLPIRSMSRDLLDSTGSPPDSEVNTPHALPYPAPHQWWESHHQTRPLVPGERPRTKSWQRRRTGYQSGHYAQAQLVFPPVPRARRCVTSMDDLCNQDDLHHMLADMCRKTKDHGVSERDTTRLLMLRQELSKLCDRRIGKECDDQGLSHLIHPTSGKPTASEDPSEEHNSQRVLLSRTRKHRLKCRKTFTALYDSSSVATLCSGRSIPTVPRPGAPDAYGKVHQHQQLGGGAGMLTSPIPCVQRQLEALAGQREAPSAAQDETSTPRRAVSTPKRDKFASECIHRRVLPMTGMLEKVKKDPKHINLAQMRLGDRLCEVLAMELAEAESAIESIDLSHNGMSEKGCTAVLTTVCGSSTLRDNLLSLKLSGNRLGNFVVEQIAEFAQQAKALQELELNHVQLQGYGTGWLMNSLGPVSYTHLTLPTKRIV